MSSAKRSSMDQDQIQYWPEAFAMQQQQQQQKYPSSPLPDEKDLIHPVPKPLYLANSNFSSFADYEESNVYPKREAVSPLIGPNHSAEDLSVFHAQSSPNSSVTTFDENCYTPMSSTFGSITPAPWSSSSSSLSSSSSTSSSSPSMPYAWNPQPSDAATMGAPWANINVPCYLSTPNQYLPPAIDATWDVAAPTNEEMMLFNGLPWVDFNTDTQTYFASPVPEITDHKAPFYLTPALPNQHIQPQPQSQFTYTTTPANTTAAAATPTRPTTAPSPSNTRNAFLIECKRRGLSYKDIKRLGGFKEAESTLRGRFRTLTKTKEQRVRKPQWEERDVRLLCEAVSILSSERERHAYRRGFKHSPLCLGTGCVRCQAAGTDTGATPRVSWKKVAGYIWLHGGSYHFGNATCKKKWCEVHNVTLK